MVDIFPEEARIPGFCRPPAAEDQREFLVGGLFRIWDGPLQDIYSPLPIRQGAQLRPRLLGRVPRLDQKTALGALDAACAAFDQGHGPWPTLGPARRMQALRDLRAGLSAHRQSLVSLLMWEVGKSLAEAEAEFDRTLSYFDETFADLHRRARDSARVEAREGIAARLGRAPLGVTLCLGPFNYPLNETFATLLPALAMGNTVVLKPPKIGVLVFRPLLGLFREIFPPGVVNVIYGEGDEILAPLMATGKIDVLAFIGSDKTAERLLRAHPRPLRLTPVLGMGAKNAAVILPGADLSRAVRECLLGSLAFNGQRCTALKILFVHQSRVEEFLKHFGAALARIRQGMPWEKGVWITPLAEPERPAYLHELLTDATARGARVLNPEGGLTTAGFFAPALLYPVTPAMRLFHEEQFGPLVPVAPFTDLAQVEDFLRNSDYAQQISLFSSDPAELAPLIDALTNRVARVNLNCKCQRGPDSFPFTGRKDSAVGTLAVSEALDAFSHPTLVAQRDGRDDRHLLDALSNDGRSRFLSDT
ncbi:aldehyde dehydrogenase family protein [Geoalkalibacter halelectricus]|uniref:Aldehyde dehydrogenase family protein n=1 Tax=Geoalkalibacter halelectricus TaxID=2847045 RepID=A0ABY5ZFL8_9BACT|nr:aldehyde dehydrogenase family protein [Geoalkalibacter halelectricus]MDO3377895.1 aldehyde dehydrogenase family protein [Geoalkalibacter halelectricus]UWZ77922.1 aldehyde dehydrogenase family protein [Geoalkalibacter halelectricus]